jgi:hypothetical protein
MKNWLQKYTDGGYIGDGYTTEGRAYSPAWNGQFYNGGEITNVFNVGDAIAENGKEIQYYQQGRDWKPKMISGDGSVIKSDNRNWFQRLNDRVYGEYQEHKPQLFKDFPVTDLPGQMVSYLTGHSDPEESLSMIMPFGKIGPSIFRPNTTEQLVVVPLKAAQMRAQRMLSQSEKFPTRGKQELIDNYKNIDNLFEVAPAAKYYKRPESLGIRDAFTNKPVLFEDAPLTAPQQKYIASHETGHLYTPPPKEAEEWLGAFNTNKLNRYLRGTPIYGANSMEALSLNKGTQLARGHAMEIRERAGQLKDFIAAKKLIPLDKNFKMTKSDLNYAIKNYVKETGLDNNMTEMFGALSSKRKFLNTMNKYALGVAGIGTLGTGVLEDKKNGGNVSYAEDGNQMQKLNNFIANKAEAREANYNLLSPKDFYLKYMQTPLYKERLGIEGLSGDKANKMMQQRVGALKPVGVEYRDDITSRMAEDPNNPGKNVIVSKKQATRLPMPYREVEEHELSHRVIGVTSVGTEKTPEGGIRMKYNATPENMVPKTFYTIQDKLKKKNKLLDRHDILPEESKADIDAMRYHLYTKGKNVLNKNTTLQELQELKKVNNFGIQRLFRLYNDDDILYLINQVAENNQGSQDNQNSISMAKNGGNVQMKDQEQLIKQLTTFENFNKKMKDGGWLERFTD